MAEKTRYLLFPFVANYELNSLLDSINSATSFTDGDDGWSPEVLLGETLYGGWHGSGEESGDSRSAFLDHCLPINIHLYALILAFHGVRGQFVQNERKFGLKSKVNHTIGLVHDDVPTLRQHKDVPLDDILETTWCSDNDLCTGSKIELLLFNRALKEWKVDSAICPPCLITTNLLTPPTMDTEVNPSGIANRFVSDSIC